MVFQILNMRSIYSEYHGHAHINICPVALAITKHPMQICRGVSKQYFKTVLCICNSCFFPSSIARPHGASKEQLPYMSSKV